MDESKITGFLRILLLPDRVAAFFTQESEKWRDAWERNRGVREERKEGALLNRIVADGHVVIVARGPGFFSEFFSVLNWLMWTQEESVALKVLWDERFRYGGNVGNHWSAFFSPFWDESVFSGTGKVVRMHRAEPDSSVFLRGPGKGPVCFKRSTACDLVRQFIRVKPEIMHTVDAFYREHFLNRHMIAIHLRSGEKDREGAQVPPPVLIDLANKLKRPDTTFFVLTDVEECLDDAKEHLEGPVVATDCLRANDQMEAVHQQYPGDLSVAREALVDTLIAARADTFLFTTSNLAFAVLAFNPELRGISVRFNENAGIDYYDYKENIDSTILPATRQAILG